MATRSCPTCGTQYVASVRRCIDCDVILVDDVDDDDVEATSTAAPVGAGEQIAYELEGWGNQLKVTLEGMLEGASVPRVWEAGALVVDARFEDQVDALIAVVEGADIPELDDDAPQIAFEIEGLDADRLAVLDARLIAESVAHAWSDEGELIVAEDDEDRVTALIEEALDADPDAAGDDLAVNERLTAVYVATDHLMKHPKDEKRAAAVAEAAAGLEGSPTPYGFSSEAWTDLLAEIDALVAALGVGGAPDEGGGADGGAEPADHDEDLGDDDDYGEGAGDGAEPSVADRAAALRNRLLDFV